MQVNIQRRRHNVVLLGLTVAMLTACGGGSDDVTPPPPPPPEPTAAQKADAESVMLIPDRLVALPQQLRNTLLGTTFSSPCGSGSVAALYDGNPLAPGASVAAGSHQLSAQFTACNYQFSTDTTVNGGLSYAYNWTAAPAPASAFFALAGRATVVATALRSTITGFADVTLDGTSESVDTIAVNGNVVTLTQTVTPAVGSTLRNEGTGRVATFRGGSASFSQTINFSGPVPILTQLVIDHAGLQADIGGRVHRIQGSETYVFAPTGQPTSATGSVVVTVDGVPAAVLEPKLPTGYTVTSVTVQSGPF